jgi:hypothetical protein
MESLEQKRWRGEWVDPLMVNEGNTLYGSGYSNTPILHHSSTPVFAESDKFKNRLNQLIYIQ